MASCATTGTSIARAPSKTAAASTTVAVLSSIAEPNPAVTMGSSIAATDNSGSEDPSSPRTAAGMTGRLNLNLNTANAACRRSNRNPPQVVDRSDSKAPVAGRSRPRQRLCCSGGSCCYRSLAVRVLDPWNCLGPPSFVYCWRRWPLLDCSPRQPLKAAGFVKAGSGDSPRLYCSAASGDYPLERCGSPRCCRAGLARVDSGDSASLYCSAASSDHLPEWCGSPRCCPSGPRMGYWYSWCAPAFGKLPLPAPCAPPPCDFALRWVASNAPSCWPRRTNSAALVWQRYDRSLEPPARKLA